MNRQGLESTAKAMVAAGKGILAMDESAPTCKKRFQALGIESTEENRRTYRDLLVTTEGLSQFISGAILFDETIRQKVSNGMLFPGHMTKVGIIPGIKVDTGAKDLAGFPGEKVTEGLDGLRDRLAEYVGMGARFTKWRAVITIGDGMPSQGCIDANAHALARYAALAQEAGMVPIVEPEVLIDGSHTIAQCYDATHSTLRAVFRELAGQRVYLPGMVLKASMVISGLECADRAGISEVADHTVPI
jgi:fructose-bisphosphate aldolase class I